MLETQPWLQSYKMKTFEYAEWLGIKQTMSNDLKYLKKLQGCDTS